MSPDGSAPSVYNSFHPLARCSLFTLRPIFVRRLYCPMALDAIPSHHEPRPGPIPLILSSGSLFSSLPASMHGHHTGSLLFITPAIPFISSSARWHSPKLTQTFCFPLSARSIPPTSNVPWLDQGLSTLLLMWYQF